ncbi:MAG TPA: hypothetical protein DD727_00515, partial [Clostridiales bacterium]|nr:hypothetical protein [Clostridiales bacterium]
RILLPLDVILLLGGLAVVVIQSILKINLGGFVSALGYWAFILGLLLSYANFHQLFLYIGLLGYGAIHLLIFLISLIFASYRYFSWGALFATAVYGGLGYLAYKKSIASGNRT